MSAHNSKPAMVRHTFTTLRLARKTTINVCIDTESSHRHHTSSIKSVLVLFHDSLLEFSQRSIPQLSRRLTLDDKHWPHGGTGKVRGSPQSIGLILSKAIHRMVCWDISVESSPPREKPSCVLCDMNAKTFPRLISRHLFISSFCSKAFY